MGAVTRKAHNRKYPQHKLITSTDIGAFGKIRNATDSSETRKKACGKTTPGKYGRRPKNLHSGAYIECLSKMLRNGGNACDFNNKFPTFSTGLGFVSPMQYLNVKKNCLSFWECSS